MHGDSSCIRCGKVLAKYAPASDAIEGITASSQAAVSLGHALVIAVGYIPPTFEPGG